MQPRKEQEQEENNILDYLMRWHSVVGLPHLSVVLL